MTYQETIVTFKDKELGPDVIDEREAFSYPSLGFSCEAVRVSRPEGPAIASWGRGV